MKFIYSHPDDFCITILVYIRKHHLNRLVKSIHKWTPETPIVVYVDRCDDNLTLREQQKELISSLETMKENRDILDYRVGDKHLNAKAAWYRAMKFGFTKSKNVLYLEDDLLLVRDPKLFINEFHSRIKSNSILTLYPRRGRHTGLLVQTDWPALWGVYLMKRDFQELYRDKLDSQEDVRNTVAESFDLLGYKRNCDENRFTNLWNFKFLKAFESKTAWDTELHYRLWSKNYMILSTSEQCVIEQESHPSSITKNKALNRKRVLNHFSAKNCTPNQRGRVFLSCKRCEKAAYFSYLPRFIAIRSKSSILKEYSRKLRDKTK